MFEIFIGGAIFFVVAWAAFLTFVVVKIRRVLKALSEKPPRDEKWSWLDK